MDTVTERISELNEKTKISINPKQFWAFIISILFLGSIYNTLEKRISHVEVVTQQQQQYGEEIQLIRETVIRIEGKLNLKQDKYR
jgi:hypothetical protein